MPGDESGGDLFEDDEELEQLFDEENGGEEDLVKMMEEVEATPVESLPGWVSPHMTFKSKLFLKGLTLTQEGLGFIQTTCHTEITSKASKEVRQILNGRCSGSTSSSLACTTTHWCACQLALARLSLLQLSCTISIAGILR